MLVLPPNTKYYFWAYMHSYYRERYDFYLVIGDTEGNILAKYKFKLVPNTDVGYTVITTPSKEGLYLLVWTLFTKDGRIVSTEYAEPLIVSEKDSLLAALRQLYEIIDKRVFRRLDVLCEEFEYDSFYVRNVILAHSRDLWATSRDIVLLLDNFIFPRVDRIEDHTENIESNIGGQIAPKLDSVKATLQKFLKWLMKRNA